VSFLSALILRRREAPSRRMRAASCFETAAFGGLLSMRPNVLTRAVD